MRVEFEVIVVRDVVSQAPTNSSTTASSNPRSPGHRSNMSR